MYSLGEHLYLLLCLQNRELRGFHDGAAANVGESEFFLVLCCLWLDDAAHDLLYLWYEPYQHEGVGDVECRVESCQNDGQACGELCCGEAVVVGVVAYERAYHVDKGIEQAEHPDDTNDVEHKVCQGCTACLGIGTKSREVCGGSRTDVLSHHQCYAEVDGQYAR